MRRRAISWLTDHGVISAEAAEQAAAASPDPVIGNGVVDIDALVSDVVADLRALYGEGLVQVLVYGSWARDEAGEDSDVGLLVVLADVVSPWAELRRMDEILWRHTDRSGVVVSAFPVSIEEFEHPASPVLIRAKAEAVPVA